MTEPTVTRRFSQALLEAATRLGIHLPALADGEERIRLDVHDALWTQLSAASDDPLIGLQLALHLQVGHLDVAGLLLMSCETLGEALELYTEYHPIVSQGGEVWFHPAGSQMALCYAGHYEVCREARAEMSLACAMHIARWCTGDQFEASAVEFRHAPRDAVSRYGELLGCEVHFEAPEDRVLFSRDLLSRPLIQANPALRDQLRELADQSLARLGDRSFAATVAETVRWPMRASRSSSCVTANCKYWPVAHWSAATRLQGSPPSWDFRTRVPLVAASGAGPACRRRSSANESGVPFGQVIGPKGHATSRWYSVA